MNSSLSDVRIVIVEDDINSTLATLELLKLGGMEKVHTFSDGETTLAFLKTGVQVDLFLLDIHLPGETGYDLIEQIRSLEEKNHLAKVVAITAGVLFDDIRRARSAGFDGFIGKPLKPLQFSNQIQRIIAGESVWEWR